MGDASDLFYGLATAFGYGTGDFLARQASHRIGHLQVLFYMEAGSLLVLLPVAFALERDLWNLGPGLAWLAGLGVVNVVASLFLYRSFEYGVLSVVSPLASSYPAVTAGLAFLFLGERPGVFASFGIVAVLLGILLLSRSEAHPDNPPPRDARVGLVSALGAFAGYGVFYFALEYVVGDFGPVSSAAIVRVFGVAALLLVSLVGLATIRVLPRPMARYLGPIALLDSLAFVAYNVGILGGSVAIVGTLSGLFSAVTVGLAAIVLRERLTAVQYGGVGAVFLGVLLMAVA